MSKPANSRELDVQRETESTPARSRHRDVPLDPRMTDVVKGVVEGAWSIDHVHEDWTPDAAFLLEEGEIRHVPAGTAIRVQSTDGWLHCDFPQSGGVYGPAVWAHAELSSEDRLLRMARIKRNNEMGPFYKVTGGGVILSGAAFLLYAMHLQGLVIEASGAEAAAIIDRISSLPKILFGGIGLSFVVGIAAEVIHRKRNPLTIKSVNQRVNKLLRMPRSAIEALSRPQQHLKLVAPTRPQDSLDEAISLSLDRYHAQRHKLAESNLQGSPMVEHTAAMMKEISLRIEADSDAMREDSLRRTYLAVIQRAEAELTRILAKKESEEAEALVVDMTALLKQMNQHS
jgi:hypothetical protein